LRLFFFSKTWAPGPFGSGFFFSRWPCVKKTPQTPTFTSPWMLPPPYFFFFLRQVAIQTEVPPLRMGGFASRWLFFSLVSSSPDPFPFVGNYTFTQSPPRGLFSPWKGAWPGLLAFSFSKNGSRPWIKGWFDHFFFCFFFGCPP